MNKKLLAIALLGLASATMIGCGSDSSDSSERTCTAGVLTKSCLGGTWKLDKTAYQTFSALGALMPAAVAGGTEEYTLTFTNSGTSDTTQDACHLTFLREGNNGTTSCYYKLSSDGQKITFGTAGLADMSLAFRISATVDTSSLKFQTGTRVASGATAPDSLTPFTGRDAASGVTYDDWFRFVE